MKRKPFTPARLRRRVFSQLWMLALQFVLGMILNLLGSESAGARRTAYTVTLVVHVLNGIGLFEGSLYIALKERSRLAWWTAVILFITLASGVLTMLTRQDSWSFVMACGFLAASWLSVMLYLHAERQLQTNKTNKAA